MMTLDLEELKAAMAGQESLAFFSTYDADQDGEVTQEEFSSYEFTRYDTNGDGELDQTEYEQSLHARGQAGIVSPLEEHDADGDGMITPEEYANSVRDDFENVEEGEGSGQGMAGFDADQSGGVNQDEYVEAQFRRYDESGDDMLDDSEFQRMIDGSGNRN